MNIQGKYITGEVKSSVGMSVGSAICFSEYIAHADVAVLFDEIWGAGFFVICDGNVGAYGKSVGLQVESRCEKDAALIKRALGLNDQ